MKQLSLLSPQLETFLAIAENKTVHAASKVLHLTQTAVSQRLQTLESKLDTSLFIRTRKGMTLTQEGEILLRYCSNIQELQGKTLSGIKSVGAEISVLVHIIGATSIMRTRVIPSCLSLINKFPKLNFYFNLSDADNSQLVLRNGSCQFAIIPLEEVMADMEHKVLHAEQYVMVCTPEWQARSLVDILSHEHIIDFDPSDQLTFNYLKQFDLFSHAQHERYFVNNTEMMAHMLMHGYGYGLLTKEFSQPYIDNNHLIVLNDHQEYLNHLALAWYSRPNMPEYLAKIIEKIN